jgi:2-polyprenyl-3-methyl-5-hydroxy-6-metoxy-1,4-benzoquinol methylase
VNAASYGTALDAIQYHDRLAIDWDRRYQKASFRARLVALAECLAGKHLNGTQWLDAGCGTGTLSRWLAAHGCSVLAVDAAPKMINFAAALASSGVDLGSLRFQLVESIAHLPLDSHSADGILCSSVLEYVPDPELCLTEFARVLRPGGILVVSVPSAHSIIRRAQFACKLVGQLVGRNWVAYLNYSKHQYSRLEFEHILISRNFCLERAVPLGGPLPRWMQRTRTWGPLLMFSARKI